MNIFAQGEKPGENGYGRKWMWRCVRRCEICGGARVSLVDWHWRTASKKNAKGRPGTNPEWAMYKQSGEEQIWDIR